MVKVTGPALSMEASGSLGGVMVFSKWKGRPYVRSLVVPSNPKSGGQVGMRAMFSFLAKSWATLTAPNQATWEDRAEQLVVSEFNAFMSYNQFRWRNFTAPSKEEPAAAVETPATVGALSLAVGVRSITVTQAITTASDGWGILFFRSPTGTFATAFDNLKAVGTVDGTDPVIFVDSPLDAGAYYYDTREFTGDGQLSAETGEETDTVV
ncbi:MAG: hypothetical protein MUP13_01380 [Thermoanaerobaculales bacterium]|nr:hypothetical protein [Thermoanaerobaculales bacterium]